MFDIAGRLTPRPAEFVIVRRDAAKAAQLFKTKGYDPIYLSARASVFKAATEKWLEEEKFPPGDVYHADSETDREHPDQFKTRMLLALAAKGWRFALAYGDMSTDFAAYAAAGIEREHVFALRHEGADKCEPGVFEACLDSWSEHLAFIEKQEDAARH